MLRELEDLRVDRDRILQRYDAVVERADAANAQSETAERRARQAVYVSEQLRKELEKAKRALQAGTACTRRSRPPPSPLVSGGCGAEAPPQPANLRMGGWR